MIDQVVKECNGKQTLRDIVKTLQDRDARYMHFRYQRLSDWRDKNRNDRLVWSEATLLEVQKGFLPGGEQTRFNVFVSFLLTLHKLITNDV